MANNFRNRSASQHSFAMVPRADIPRSKYLLQQKRKQAFDGGDLVPFYCEELIPGDHFKGESTIYARLATPITPVLDNAELETFFFAVPLRILWDNFEAFMEGENYLIPKLGSYGSSTSSAVGGLFDHFGLPTDGQLGTAITNTINALPFRAYNKIYNEWFRDQNLTTAASEQTGDGPDDVTEYQLLKRAKKHDYFTSSLPWPQKGTAVSLPLGTTAPVRTATADIVTGAQLSMRMLNANDGSIPTNNRGLSINSVAGIVGFNTTATTAAGAGIYPSNLYTDLSAATASTINTIRTAFQVQKYLERMARGGSRYTEIVQSQFGVHPQDFRLQRPEYIGGGRTMVNSHPIAQTSSTDATTPLGNLAAFTTAHGGNHRFNYAATEHCYIIGLVNVRTDLTYQQGIRKHFLRSTNLDFYTPVFAHLGEQAVQSREIYADGSAGDLDTFGYQERWAEYRYTPNEITGLFKSTAAGTIDVWHYGEDFATRPSLNNTFITDPSEAVLARSMAVGEEAAGQQILMDVLHQVQATRPMPTYSVPGLIDHF